MSNNIASFCVELDAVFNDGGLRRAYTDFIEKAQLIKNVFTDIQNSSEFNNTAITNAAENSFNSMRGGLEEFFNYTSEVFLNLDTLIKTVWDNMVSSFFEAIAQMAANAVLSSIFGGGGFLGGIFGGILGGRRSGGPIDKTGPYYLHEGEFVLPPEVVNAVRGGSFEGALSNQSSNSSAGIINVTVNAPVTLNGSNSDKADAQKLCEEIARAARRGVNWAVEQAKISYKVGRDRSSESSL